jgi:iduronate 2-sulfatase
VPEAIEGRSFARVLRRPREPFRDVAYSVFLREGIWVAPDGFEYFGRTIRTDRYRYVEWMRRGETEVVARELYDHETDPRETRNVVEQPEHRELLEALARRMAQAARPM